MKYIDTELLNPHEEINNLNLKTIEKIVKSNNNMIFKPIIVDKESLLVLDWHHRLEVAKKLFMKKVPVIFINYHSEDIILETATWMSKKEIEENSLKWKLLFPKSTFHYIIKDWYKIHISEVFY